MLKVKISHLFVSGVFIAIDELIGVSFGEIFETVFPHECRRSGLKVGTIRKWRLDIVDDVVKESRCVRSRTDITQRTNSVVYEKNRNDLKSKRIRKMILFRFHK